MGPGFKVRPAAAHEMAAVARLFREYAGALGVDLGFQRFEAELAGLPGRDAPPDGVLLVAISPDGDAVGCVAVRKLSETGSCEMKRLHVAPAVRKAGVGRALAMSAIEAAGKAGYRAMRLDTLPGMEAAQALYRSLGFETTPAYYETPVSGTIFMRRELAAG